MNKWFRRAVGTVGIAGGALLLSAGTAQADDSGTAAKDPQLLHSLVEQYFSPMGGLTGGGGVTDPGLSGAGLSAGALPDAPPVTSGTDNGQTGIVLPAPDGSGERRDVYSSGAMPDLFRALPISNVVPTEGLGLPAAGATESSPLGGDGIPVRNVPLSIPPTLPDGNDVGLPDARSLPPGAGLPVGNGLPTTGGLPVGNGLPTTGGLPLNGTQEMGSLTRSASAVTGSSTNPLLAVAGGDLTRSVAGSDLTRSVAGSHLTEAIAGGDPTEAGAADALPAAPLPHSGLPSANGLPILSDMLADGLPMRGNINTLPNTAPIPLGESATTQPELGEGLPIFRQVTGGGLALKGGLTGGDLTHGGLTGGLTRGGLTGGGLTGGLTRGGLPGGGLTHGGLGGISNYIPRHAAGGY